jgi:hypothetical protein
MLTKTRTPSAHWEIIKYRINVVVQVMCSEKLHRTETSLSGLRRSGLLRSVGWQLITDVSAFKSPRAKQVERPQQLNCFTLDNGNDAMSRNVGNQLPTHAAQYPRKSKTSTTSQRKTELSKLVVKFKTSVEILFTGTRKESTFHFFSLPKSESRFGSDGLHQLCLNVEYMVILEQEQN